ncbi:IS1249 family transposase [Sediminivirga luteola]|uniref:IS1249 family transposase n=1 Tax=Sediminivirga luteola TaxID=1774748 RepID=UPI001F57F1EA|nr:IS1249 family transposase [Sediminivirga luteola]
MPDPRNHPRCGVCASKLVRNGKTSAGRTRWRCKTCGASQTQARPDTTRKAELAAFLHWLLGPAGVAHLDTPRTTFHRRTQWCWNIPVAPPAATGQIHRQLILDGTYFQGWCVLVAYTGPGGYVLDWQWCDRESTASWTALIERIPAPDIAVIDGNRPCLTVIKKHWPDTKIQRCWFHLRHGIHRHLTRRPVLPANKELLALTKALMRVTTMDEAAAWTGQFTAWEAKWGTFLKQRTQANAPGAVRPSTASTGATWWYTHLRSRRAHGLLAGVLKAGHMFTWIEHSATSAPVASTTNALEGGINAGIKNLLRAHRGLSDKHAVRAVDWFLWHHTDHHPDPWGLAEPKHWERAKQQREPVAQERLGPAGYDSGFSWEDGNGIQKGWGGRRR